MNPESVTAAPRSVGSPRTGLSILKVEAITNLPLFALPLAGFVKMYYETRIFDAPQIISAVIVGSAMLSAALCATGNHENGSWTLLRSLPLSGRAIWTRKILGSLLSVLTIIIFTLVVWLAFQRERDEVLNYLTTAGNFNRIIGIAAMLWGITLICGIFLRRLFLTVAVAIGCVALPIGLQIIAPTDNSWRQTGNAYFPYLIGTLFVLCAVALWLKWRDFYSAKPVRMRPHGLYLSTLFTLRTEMAVLMLLALVRGIALMYSTDIQQFLPTIVKHICSLILSEYYLLLLVAFFVAYAAFAGILMFSGTELSQTRTSLMYFPVSRTRWLFIRIAAYATPLVVISGLSSVFLITTYGVSSWWEYCSASPLILMAQNYYSFFLSGSFAVVNILLSSMLFAALLTNTAGSRPVGIGIFAILGLPFLMIACFNVNPGTTFVLVTLLLGQLYLINGPLRTMNETNSWVRALSAASVGILTVCFELFICRVPWHLLWS